MRKSRKSALSSKKQNHINHQATKRHVAQIAARVGNSQGAYHQNWIKTEQGINDRYKPIWTNCFEVGLGGLIWF